MRNDWNHLGHIGIIKSTTLEGFDTNKIGVC